MVYQLVVPGPIEDVEEVRVLEWHVKKGEVFEAETIAVELETHKAVIEVRTTAPGVLRRVICPQGAWQKIGEPLALLSDGPDDPLPDETGPDLPLMPVEFEIT